MRKKDFTLIKRDDDIKEYWFAVQGESEAELTRKYHDDQTVAVIQVGFLKLKDTCAVKKLLALGNNQAAVKVQLVQDLKIRNMARALLHDI